MDHVCHIFDESAGWAERMSLRVLAGGTSVGLTVAARPAVARMLLAGLPDPLPPTINLVARSAFFARAVFARAVRARGCGLIHAWGVKAAAIARPCEALPLVVDVRDPRLSSGDIKLLRIITGQPNTAVVCGSGVVRRGMIEGGISPDRCVIIRPGVDFSFINAVKRSHLRERIGIMRSDIAILLPPAEAPEQALVEALLATLTHARRHPDTRVILPGLSREALRLRRFAERLPGDVVSRLVCTGDDVPFEELLGIADLLLLTTKGDIPTTAIAWAMASRAAVIAPAVPAVAEMIAHRHNGLLLNTARARSLVVPIMRLLGDRAAWQKAKEEAHGQAFEVFRAKRCLEQYAALYQNLERGAPPGEGIADTAFAA